MTRRKDNAVPQHTPPRPATELFPESLNLSPKQREVLNVLQGFDGGARAVDIANALNMHVNTARGHLDELGGVGPGAVPTHPCDTLLDAGGRDGDGLVEGAFQRCGAPGAGGVHSGLLT